MDKKAKKKTILFVDAAVSPKEECRIYIFLRYYVGWQCFFGGVKMIKIKRHKIKSNKPTFVFIMQFASQPESFKHCFSQLHCLRSCCSLPL